MPSAPRSSRDRVDHEHSHKAARKRGITQIKVRSALTNGSMLIDADHRLGWMRRLRDLIMQHEADLGGENFISESERRLVRRAAMLTLQCEMLEKQWASNSNGEAGSKSLDVYQRATSNLRRLLETLGMKRRPRNVTPTVDEYCACICDNSADWSVALDVAADAVVAALPITCPI